MNVENSRFEDNYGRWEPGAINNCGEMNVTNCTFTHNVAGWWAGAVHTHTNAYTRIVGSTFTDNLAGGNSGTGWNGGALFSYSKLEVVNSTFNKNNCSVLTGGGAIFGYSMGTSTYNITVDSCNFTQNINKHATGYAGAIGVQNIGYLTIFNSNFVNNSANNGQAIAAVTKNEPYCMNCTNCSCPDCPNCTNCSHNVSSGYPTTKIYNNTFVNHTGSGDTVYIAGNHYFFENNTFTNSTQTTLYDGSENQDGHTSITSILSPENGLNSKKLQSSILSEDPVTHDVIYVNSSSSNIPEQEGCDGQSWETAYGGRSCLGAAMQYINANGTIYMADVSFASIVASPGKNITVIGLNREKTIFIKKTGYVGAQDNDLNYAYIFKNITFNITKFNIGHNFVFINCTFINSNMSSWEDTYSMYQGAPENIELDASYSVNFTNCDFVNSTLNAYRFGQVNFKDCTFENITADSIVNNTGGFTLNDGIFFSDCTFNNVNVKGIVDVPTGTIIGTEEGSRVRIEGCTGVDGSDVVTEDGRDFINTTQSRLETSIELSLDDDGNLLVTLKDSEGNAISDVEVGVRADSDEDFTPYQIDEGVAVVDISYYSGAVTFYANFVGNDEYAESSNSAEFYLPLFTSLDAILYYYENDEYDYYFNEMGDYYIAGQGSVYARIYLTDEDGNGIYEGLVDVYINDEYVQTIYLESPDIDDYYLIDTSSLNDNAENTIAFVYNTTESYKSSSDDISLYVYTKRAYIVMEVSDVVIGSDASINTVLTNWDDESVIDEEYMVLLYKLVENVDDTEYVLVAYTDEARGNYTFTIDADDLALGEYRVEAIFGGEDSQYAPDSQYDWFEVKEKYLDISWGDHPFSVENDVELNIYVIDSIGNPVAANITLSVEGLDPINITVPESEDGYSVNIGKFPVGNHHFAVSFAGDDEYPETSFEDTFIVMDEVKLVIGASDIYEGEDATINFTFVASNGALLNGTIYVEVWNNDDTFYEGIVNMTEGKGSLTLSGITDCAFIYGAYDFEEYLSGRTYTYIKVLPVVKVADISLAVSDDGSSVIATLADENGPIANASLEILVNDEKSTATTDADGKANIPIAANATVKVSYTNADDSISSTDLDVIVFNNTVEVNNTIQVPVYVAANASIAIATEDGSSATVTLTDLEGKAISNATISISVNGKEETAVTDAEGKATVAVSGNSTVAASYVDANNITSTSYMNIIVINNVTEKIVEVNNTIEVVPNRTATSIEYSNMTTTSVVTGVDGRIGEYFNVTLKDASGKALANKTVQIGFNGKVYTRTTDENGHAELQINLKAEGRYTFAIAYLGDDNYTGSFEVALITVEKQTPKLTTANKAYKASAKTKSISATLKSASGNPVSGAKVTFTVNGKTYTAKTNSKGVATVNVSLSKKGTYNFTVKSTATDAFASVSKAGKLTIK